jgi:hypothetical protein
MHICIKLIFIFKLNGIEVILLSQFGIKSGILLFEKMCLPDLSVDQN